MNSKATSPTSQLTSKFAIIETVDGLTVAMLERGMTAEETAARHNGVLIDPGPYKTYEDAFDAIADLMEVEDERE